MTNEEIATLVNHARAYRIFSEHAFKAIEPFRDAQDPNVAESFRRATEAADLADRLTKRVRNYIDGNP